MYDMNYSGISARTCSDKEPYWIAF